MPGKECRSVQKSVPQAWEVIRKTICRLYYPNHDERHCSNCSEQDPCFQKIDETFRLAKKLRDQATQQNTVEWPASKEMTMLINADFTKRVVVRPGDTDWISSPTLGVERLMLDRIGDEVARATSLVRFAPGSSFPEHTHDGGEEFLVLEGTFSDQDGDFGPGAYVRNPIGSSHAPFTTDGALILVKLWQFQKGDHATVQIDTQSTPFSPGLVEGLSVLPLHHYKQESVALVRWQPGTKFQRHGHLGGEEIYVLEGMFQDEFGDYPAGTWTRNPEPSPHTPFSDQGCLIYVKVGHIENIEVRDDRAYAALSSKTIG